VDIQGYMRLSTPRMYVLPHDNKRRAHDATRTRFRCASFPFDLLEGSQEVVSRPLQHN
jgi:hypothetical protein